MHGDLRLWLGGVAASSAEWVPRYFELSFGLPIDDAHDEASVPDPIVIDGRYPIRGAIDLVEVHGALGSLRVTDHKTGKNRTTRGLVVGGGGTLQPIIYTLVAERLLERPVSYARLSFATTAGGFTEHPVSVRDEHRRAGVEVLEIVDRAVEAGALPQSPKPGACLWCDFRAVCGPLEEQRAGRKNSRLGVLERSGGAARHAVSVLADAVDRDRIRTSLDETFAVEAAAGTGKTTVLVDRIVNGARVRADDGRAHRRGDVLREGGGRAEAAPACRARDAAPGGGDGRRRAVDDRAGRGPRQPRTGARQHDPHLLRRPAARAAGRGAHRSALHDADRAAGAGAVRRRCSATGCRRGSRRRRRASAGRCAGAATTMPGPSAASSAPRGRWPNGATSPAPWATRRVRSGRPRRCAGRRASSRSHA